MKPIWIMPAWIKIGAINRHHWFGCGLSRILPCGRGFGTPSKPHSSLREQVVAFRALDVVFGQGKDISILEFWTPGTLCMQGT